jgi:hypothetical protein
MGRKTQYRFHGAQDRFEVTAEFIGQYFGPSVRYIADVAGGKGILSKLLRKRYNYVAEVVDPRGWRIKGVPGREEEFAPEMASYYDLIVGLHPDEATRAVAGAATARPTLLVPCCNFWSTEKLGRDELVEAIEAYYHESGVDFERIQLPFKGPKNVGILSTPPGDPSPPDGPEITEVLASIERSPEKNT